MMVKCPQCGKESAREGNSYWPFCSQRCKLLDLGRWLEGGYRIAAAAPLDPSNPSEAADVAELSSAQNTQNQGTTETP